MPEASQRYAAFVSYRHMPRDREWAIRIMRALETYRTPAPLKREAFPDRIGHLFRDEDEIPASSDLSDQIKEALARSDYLIVVCSPDTPGSRWVRREIELFQELGKGERIIPLLIAGEPDESFPPELRRRRAEGPEGPAWEEVEPIAADVRRRGDESAARTERRALLRLAAVLLGCRYDDLARRDDERRRAIWRARALAAACVLLGAAGGGVWWWDAYRRVKTEYCAAYAERFGVPECVGEIAGDGWQHQYRSFRLTLRAGRVLELARVNGSGTPTVDPETPYEVEPWTEGVARWNFVYDGTLAAGQPRLNRVTMFGANGRQVRQASYNFAVEGSEAVAGFDKGLGVAERQTAAGTALGAMATAGTDAQGQHSSIGQHRLFFNAEGRLSRRLFEPVGGGASIADAAGVYGRAYSYTSQGLVAGTRNLDAEGKTLIDRLGGAAVRRDYDPRGRLLAVTWQDASGQPRANDQNIAVAAFSRDVVGRIEATAYRGQAGTPAPRKDWKVARITQRHDDRGNMIGEAYFSADGKPILREDIWVARITWRYDEHGNKIEEAYFDTDGKSRRNMHDGAARIIWRCDERGNKVEETYFNTDGTPMLSNDSVARITWRYDERGNVVEQAYFDTDGSPIQDDNDSAARIIWRHDELGNETEKAFFGVDGKPTLSTAADAAKITWLYDERGNTIEEAYFGTDGKPVLGAYFGSARVTTRYDERGNAIEWAYFGIDGQPSLRKDVGAARVIIRYDEHGNESELVHFGADGKPVLSKDSGAARVTWRYDERGNVIDEAYFGTDGRPIPDRYSGEARRIRRYDERGNVIDEAYFGADGKPMLSTLIDGTARRTDRYDEHGNKIDEAYFGVDGKPVLSKALGAAHISSRYDEHGNEIEREYFGIDGKPMLSKLLGAAHISSRYDEHGNEIEWEYFGIDGKPVLSKLFGAARLARSYDEHGNIVEAAYFDANGKSMLVDGIGSRVRYAYDDANEVNRVTYLDERDRIIPVEVEVREIAQGSVAEQIDVMPGDRLLTYAGETLTCIEQLIVMTAQPGTGPRELTFRHGTTIASRQVPPGRLGVSIANVRTEAKPVAASPPPSKSKPP